MKNHYQLILSALAMSLSDSITYSATTVLDIINKVQDHVASTPSYWYQEATRKDHLFIGDSYQSLAAPLTDTSYQTVHLLGYQRVYGATGHATAACTKLAFDKKEDLIAYFAQEFTAKEEGNLVEQEQSLAQAERYFTKINDFIAATAMKEEDYNTPGSSLLQAIKNDIKKNKSYTAGAIKTLIVEVADQVAADPFQWYQWDAFGHRLYIGDKYCWSGSSLIYEVTLLGDKEICYTLGTPTNGCLKNRADTKEEIINSLAASFNSVDRRPEEQKNRASRYFELVSDFIKKQSC